MADNKDMETLKKKLADVTNNCFALHQNLGLIQTAGQSTVIMAECLKLSEKIINILQKGTEE
jgi:hypothetical protein